MHRPPAAWAAVAANVISIALLAGCPRTATARLLLSRAAVNGDRQTGGRAERPTQPPQNTQTPPPNVCGAIQRDIGRTWIASSDNYLDTGRKQYKDTKSDTLWVQQEDGTFMIHLPDSPTPLALCEVRQTFDFSSIGCLKVDSVHGEVRQTVHFTMTVQKCFAICLDQKERYFGLTEGKTCWCGSFYDGVELEEAACNVPCEGKTEERCGGKESIANVYVIFDLLAGTGTFPSKVYEPKPGVKFDLHAEDFTVGTFWNDRIGVALEEKGGTPSRETREGRSCVKLHNDRDFFQYRLNIDPSEIKRASMEVYFYMDSRGRSRGWVAGEVHKKEDNVNECVRYMTLHDDRAPGLSPSCAASMSAGEPKIHGWNHMVVVWDGAQAFVYNNGVKSHTIAYAQDACTDTARCPGRFRVGSPKSGYSADVCLSSVRIFDRALSEMDVADSYTEWDEATAPTTTPSVMEMSQPSREKIIATYASFEGQTCGKSPKNRLKLDGLIRSTTMTGTAADCSVACARDSMKCHGFTYSKSNQKCTFHESVVDGEVFKGKQYACYFKKISGIQRVKA